jgi:hypothetical protein
MLLKEEQSATVANTSVRIPHPLIPGKPLFGRFREDG